MHLWCAKVNDSSYTHSSCWWYGRLVTCCRSLKSHISKLHHYCLHMKSTMINSICYVNFIAIHLQVEGTIVLLDRKSRNPKVWHFVSRSLSPDNSTVRSNCSDGDVTLVGGSDEYEGRVEVCINQAWGTVCNGRYSWRSSYWGTADGRVVCRQLRHQELGKHVCMHLWSFGA